MGYNICNDEKLVESEMRVANIYYYEFPKVYCLLKIYYNVQSVYRVQFKYELCYKVTLLARASKANINFN